MSEARMRLPSIRISSLAGAAALAIVVGFISPTVTPTAGFIAAARADSAGRPVGFIAARSAILSQDVIS